MFLMATVRNIEKDFSHSIAIKINNVQKYKQLKTMAAHILLAIKLEKRFTKHCRHPIFIM